MGGTTKAISVAGQAQRMATVSRHDRESLRELALNQGVEDDPRSH